MTCILIEPFEVSGRPVDVTLIRLASVGNCQYCQLAESRQSNGLLQLDGGEGAYGGFRKGFKVSIFSWQDLVHRLR
jgi:hypothetical protein